MKYIYPVIYSIDNKEINYFFYDLPSGINTCSIEEKEEAFFSTLYELLTDEEFLHHSELKEKTDINKIDVKNIGQKVLNSQSGVYFVEDVLVEL